MGATIPPRDSPHNSPLGRLLTRRIVWLLLGVSGLGIVALVAFNAYETRREHAAENAAAISANQAKLALLQGIWQQSAEHLATAIDLQRISQIPEPARWERLSAWFTALEENLIFDSAIVRDKQGRVLLAYGNEKAEAVRIAALDGDWYFSADNQELHRVLRAPLWLGAEHGRGQLILLLPFNRATLLLLGDERQRLYLARGGQRLLGADDQPVPLLSGASFETPEGRWRMLRVPLAGTDDFSLMLRIADPTPAWQAVVVFGALGMAITVFVLFHAIFGRWMRVLLKRIHHLDQASEAYRAGAPLGEARALLAAARGQRDEISQLGDAIDDLFVEVHARDQEQRAYLETLNLLEEVVIELDPSGAILRASSAWPRLAALSCEADDRDFSEADDHDFIEYLHPDDTDKIRTVFDALGARKQDQYTVRVRLCGRGLQDVWVECRFVPALDETGRVVGIRGVLRDITQTYMQEKQITHMALHDALTGLPNRVLLEDRAKMALHLATRSKLKVGLCFFDLDHFKHVNDTLGHKTGDRLLIAFSDAVRACIRAGDTLVRWSGDEFVLLIPDMESVASIREVVEKIARLSQTPVEVDDAKFTITFSMGVTVFPDDGDNVDALLSHADRAMFYAKSQGRNTWQFYCDMKQKGLGKNELYIQQRLAAAIKSEIIQAWFQPKVDARDGRVKGVEALTRWYDPELGWVSPATFVPMAESIGLIRELGALVWLATLRAGQAWKARGLTLNLAVNISKRQLFIPYFTEKLLQDLDRFGLEPGDITLEVTESIALTDVELATERLNELGRAGFRISIDDFGTGYSSLSQLHEMPVHELKIDISFVRRIDTPQGMRVIQAITQMAGALNLECVAEGVEDAAAAEKLTTLGVNTLQGYLFAKPMPLEEFDPWLETQPA